MHTVVHLEHLRIACHTETTHAQGMTFRQMEIETCATEQTTTAVRLLTVLQHVAGHQTLVQHLATLAA